MDHPVGRRRPLPLSAEVTLAALLRGPVEEAARGLLGARLMRLDKGETRVGRIMEVEAYGGPEDRASHARFGPTARTSSMFGAPGQAYVYGVYGMHTCINVVVGARGTAAAILVRAVEPIAGLGAMRAARLARALATRRADRADPGSARDRIERLPARQLAAGPGNVAAAFSVELSDDGVDLLDPQGTLRLAAAPAGEEAAEVIATARVGVAYAGTLWAGLPWRFVARRTGGEGRSGTAGRSAGGAGRT